MLSQNDLNSLSQRGITPQTVEQQLNRFVTGFPYLKLYSAASVGAGIKQLTPEQEHKAVEDWDNYLADGGSVTKFVPASGAASRMFKALFAYVNAPGNDAPAPGSDVAKLIDNVDNLPFLSELNKVLLEKYDADVHQLIDGGRYKEVVAAIVNPDGMNYGALPKALLTFHRYGDGTTRTPLEEQLTEGAEMAASNGTASLHFTVSQNHIDLFKKKLAEVKPLVEQRKGVKFNVDLSIQKPSTDTVAATADNKPFRDKNGEIVFRPGGHGALIQNLADIHSTVVFVKNIDNVVPDSQRSVSNHYKKVMAGVLVETVAKIHNYYNILATGQFTESDLVAIRNFMADTLCINGGALDNLKGEALAKEMMKKLNRPVRVCGMVKNEGEPGGGPYLAYNPDGTYSPQILESSQINLDNPENAEMMAHATHFNPVDLVCWLESPDGHKFNLPDYVDPDTGFISSKSLDGRDLKALELPGLWNGAMSDWNTIFLEVPAATFNPVKTVNDLLRPVHQANANIRSVEQSSSRIVD